MNSPHRCFIPPEDWGGSEAVLSADESHYVLDVLRLRGGDALTAFDGRGRLAEAELLAGPDTGRRGRREARAAVRLKGVRDLPRPLPRLTLLQAIAKPARMDWLVEKATELGVGTLVPLILERVVGASHGEENDSRDRRWHRIALSAARQCGTPWLPDIRPVCTLEKALSTPHPWDVLVVGALTPSAVRLHAALEACRGPVAHAALLIGPEGDFTPAEMAVALGHGALPVTFGPLVLRVETAAIFGLSALIHELTRRSEQG